MKTKSNVKAGSSYAIGQVRSTLQQIIIAR